MSLRLTAIHSKDPLQGHGKMAFSAIEKSSGVSSGDRRSQPAPPVGELKFLCTRIDLRDNRHSRRTMGQNMLSITPAPSSVNGKVGYWLRQIMCICSAIFHNRNIQLKTTIILVFLGVFVVFVFDRKGGGKGLERGVLGQEVSSERSIRVLLPLPIRV